MNPVFENDIKKYQSVKSYRIHDAVCYRHTQITLIRKRTSRTQNV